MGFAAVAVPKLRPWAAGIGATWAALAFAILGPMSQRATIRAALIQNQFDTWLYGLDRGDHVRILIDDSELVRWSKRSTQEPERFKTWYPDVVGLPDLLAVLSCQRANLSWDTTLRRRYADRLTIAAAAVAAAGVIAGLVFDLKVRTLILGFFVPCTPALLLALQGATSQRDIATAKDTLLVEVRTTIDSLVETGGQQDPEIWNRASQYQDQLFDQRCRTERVLGRIYEQHREQDEDVMQMTVDELRRRIDTR
jgi:hypothetical protein